MKDVVMNIQICYLLVNSCTFFILHILLRVGLLAHRIGRCTALVDIMK